MLGNLVREVAKAAGEVVASPLTIANAAAKAVEREVKEATEPKK